MALLNRIGWIKGALSNLRKYGNAFATNTALPIISAPVVASRTLEKWTLYWPRMRFVVSRIRLKPTAKNIVGGIISSSSFLRNARIDDMRIGRFLGDGFAARVCKVRQDDISPT